MNAGGAHPKEDAALYTKKARELVLAAWSGIVAGLIKKAKDGGYQQTKLLLDLCEITNVGGSQVDDQGRRELCDALLDGLGLTLEPEAASALDSESLAE